MTSIHFRARRFANRTYRRVMGLIPHPSYREQAALLEVIGSQGIPRYITFDADVFASQVLGFVDSMHCGGFAYRYSSSVAAPTLYSSLYACLTMALFGKLDQLGDAQKEAWADYLSSFQDPVDGLFRDRAVANSLFEQGDWWGARHLVLHAITAFARLGQLPKHPFGFLSPFKSLDRIDRWLGGIDWTSPSLAQTDVDNKIMNVVCALQFERDFRNDSAAGLAVTHIFSRLVEALDASTGLWGSVDTTDAHSLSRAVQFAYHLHLPMLYEGRAPSLPDRLVDLVLSTQNKLGGYGAKPNASACEDIDSIDLLCRLASSRTYREADVALSLERSLPWQLANQNEDGGFVFRRNEGMAYGHELMSSVANESAMFPTWFRSLSVCYTVKRLRNAGFNIGMQPGLQFWAD